MARSLIVTGASAGIGRLMAVNFLEADWRRPRSHGKKPRHASFDVEYVARSALAMAELPQDENALRETWPIST